MNMLPFAGPPAATGDHPRAWRVALASLLLVAAAGTRRADACSCFENPPCAALGISLRSATEPIDDTSTGKLMEGVLAAFAQFDNDVRSDRTKAGMRAALDLGRWVFLAPIGDLNAPRATGKSLMAYATCQLTTDRVGSLRRNRENGAASERIPSSG